MLKLLLFGAISAEYISDVPNSEISGFDLDYGLLYVYGKDVFYTLNNENFGKIEKKTSAEHSIACIRSSAFEAAHCHNFIQFARQIANLTLFCGTDAAFQNCYIYNGAKELNSFSANHLVGFGPGQKTLVTVLPNEDKNMVKIVSAAPKNLNENVYGVYLSEINLGVGLKTPIRGTESQFRGQTQFFTTVSINNHQILIGKENSDSPSNAFAFHVCANDPGLYSERSELLSAARAPLNCCKNNLCFPNLVDARVVKHKEESMLFGLFKSNSNNDSALCVFRERGLVFRFLKGSKLASGGSFGVKNNEIIRRPTECAVYDDFLHKTLSNFIIENGPIELPTISGEVLDLGRDFTKFDIANLREELLLVLINAENVARKTLITKKNSLLINHNLKFKLNGKYDVTEVRIYGDKMITIENKSAINSQELSRCQTYESCASCIAIGDIMCGWSLEEKKCKSVYFDKNLVQNVADSLNSVQEYCEIETFYSEKVFLSTNKDPITVWIETTAIATFDELTWVDTAGNEIGNENKRFFPSYQASLGRANLVIYPSQDNLGEIDGIYQLLYKIRGIVIYSMNFTVLTLQDDLEPILDDLEPDKPTELAGGHLFTISAAIVGFLILLAVITIFCYKRKVAKKDFKFSHPLRGQPSGESIHENDKNTLCEVAYESGFASRQSPNQQTELLRDCDGQSESVRSDKDHSDVFVSCPSQQGSLSSIELTEHAAILYPDGTMKRVPTRTLEKIKHEMKDDPDSEKFITGTLRKNSKRKK